MRNNVDYYSKHLQLIKLAEAIMGEDSRSVAGEYLEIVFPLEAYRIYVDRRNRFETAILELKSEYGFSPEEVIYGVLSEENVTRATYEALRKGLEGLISERDFPTYEAYKERLFDKKYFSLAETIYLDFIVSFVDYVSENLREALREIVFEEADNLLRSYDVTDDVFFRYYDGVVKVTVPKEDYSTFRRMLDRMDEKILDFLKDYEPFLTALREEPIPDFVIEEIADAVRKDYQAYKNYLFKKEFTYKGPEHYSE